MYVCLLSVIVEYGYYVMAIVLTCMYVKTVKRIVAIVFFTYSSTVFG